MSRRLIDMLPKIPQYEDIPYAVDFECPECGKTFIKNGYTKREICEDCYKKYRLKISRDYRKNKRKATKKESLKQKGKL